MATSVQTFLGENSGMLDPVAQAVNIYAQLKGVDRSDREMKLREAEAARAERADVRAAETHAQGIKLGDVNLKRSQFELTEQEKKALREEKNRKWMGEVAKLTANPNYRPADPDLAAVMTHARGMASPGMSAVEAQTVIDAWRDVGAGIQQLASDPAVAKSGQPLVIRGGTNDPKRQQFLKSLDTAIGGKDRTGKVFSYTVNGQTLTGRTVPLDQGGAVYYDPSTASMSVAFAVVDVNTGAPLKDAAGQPMLVPATEDGSNSPDSKITARPVADILATAKTAIIANNNAVNAWYGLDFKDKLKAVWAMAAQDGSPEALAQLQVFGQSDALIKSLEGMKGKVSGPENDKVEFIVSSLKTMTMTPTQAFEYAKGIFGEAITNAYAEKKSQFDAALAQSQATWQHNLNMETERFRARASEEERKKDRNFRAYLANQEIEARRSLSKDEYLQRLTITAMQLDQAYAIARRELELKEQAIQVDREGNRIKAGAVKTEANTNAIKILDNLHDSYRDSVKAVREAEEKAAALYAQPATVKKTVKGLDGVERRETEQEFLERQPSWKNAMEAAAEARHRYEMQLRFLDPKLFSEDLSPTKANVEVKGNRRPLGALESEGPISAPPAAGPGASTAAPPAAPAQESAIPVAWSRAAGQAAQERGSGVNYGIGPAPAVPFAPEPQPPAVYGQDVPRDKEGRPMMDHQGRAIVYVNGRPSWPGVFGPQR